MYVLYVHTYASEYYRVLLSGIYIGIYIYIYIYIYISLGGRPDPLRWEARRRAIRYWVKVHRLRENKLLSKIWYGQKVGMIGRTELESDPDVGVGEIGKRM